MDCYIYYRVACADEALVVREFGKLKAHLPSTLQPVLQRRPDSQDGQYTWMEVYRQVPADFSALQSAALMQTDLPNCIHGERHHEYFMEVAICA
jgi:hypothetical protein